MGIWDLFNAKKKYQSSILKTDSMFEEWCSNENIPLHSIHHVASWERWDDGISVYIFLNKQSEVESLSDTESIRIQEMYMEFLKRNKYSCHKFPNVLFEIDSDENVQKYFDGSYFYRLR